MASSINKVTLVGRLGKTPELSFLPSGVAVAKFPIATDEQWTDKDGNKQERTEWHNIVAWRKLAEICAKYLVKGKLIYIDGKIQTRSYDDKEGNKRYITEVIADNMVMLSRTGEGDTADAANAAKAAAATATASFETEGIPTP